MSEKKTTGCLAGGCGFILALILLGSLLSAIFPGNTPQQPTGDARSPRERNTSRQLRPVESTALENVPAPKDRHAELAELSETNRNTAYYFGREACKQILKSPSSAKFSNLFSDPNTGTEPYGYKQWKVFGFVDAQNSFGAMMRENWMAVVKMDELEAFRVLYLQCGNETSGKLPPISVAPETPQDRIDRADARDAQRQAAAETVLKYWEPRAATNDAYAQFRLGEIYRDGAGVDKDLVKARAWFLKAAAAGQTDASNALQRLQ